MVDSRANKTLVAVFFNLLLLLGLAATAPTSRSNPIAQQPEITSKEKSTSAQRLYDEGIKLYEQGTVESLRQAIQKWEQASALYRSTGDRVWEAATLSNIGIAYSHLGQKQQALDYYNRALPLTRAVGDRAGEATTLDNIGVVYDDLGQKQQALDYYNRALPLTRAVGDRAGEANTLNNIGKVYYALGQKQQALDYYNQALPLTRAVGDRAGEANTLNNIGKVYYALGQKQQALDYYNQALPLWKAVGDRAGEATTLSNIGAVYDDLGQKQQALDYYNQALPLTRAVGDRAGEATTLNNIGAVYNDLGQNQQALDYYNRALPLTRAVGDRSGEATTLSNIGGVYYRLGQKQQALDYYNRALPPTRAVGDRAGEATTLSNIAYVQRSRGNLQQALTSIQASIDIVENLRNNIASSELRTSYFATVQHYYQFYIDILMELHQQQPNKGYNLTALEVSERARAKTLLELLQQPDLRQGIDPQLKQKRDRLLQQLAAKTQYQQQTLGSNPTQAQIQAIQQELNQLQIQLQNLEAEIRSKNLNYALLKLSLKAPDIQQKIVDENTIVLSYWLGEERSYLWAVTPSSITSYQLPSRTEIETAANEFLKYATNASESRKYPKKANVANLSLSQMLLSPVAKQLGQKRLIIIGDGILQYLPFSTLINPQSDRSLVAQHEIINLPSASTLDAIRAQANKRQLAAKQIAILADPVFSLQDPRVQKSQPPAPTARPSTLASNENIENTKRSRAATAAGFKFDRLPGTEREAQQILALVPTASEKKLAVGFDAARTFATSPELSQYRLVHFATHGFYNQENPELSGIVLSLVNQKGEPQKEGVLLVSDIFNLNLPVDLVVLSACRTIAGKEVKGEGIVGLTRGLIYAGANRVVVSLWKVDDDATAAFMSRFYREILVNQQTPAAALRATQLWIQTQTNWKEPEYWSAFVLQGEW